MVGEPPAQGALDERLLEDCIGVLDRIGLQGTLNHLILQLQGNRK